MIEVKQCTKCNEIKPVSEFGKAKTGKYGVRGACKECQSKWSKIYREKNREKIQASYKQWYEDNHEKRLEYNKQWYEDNHEKRLEYYRQYRESNAEDRNQYHKQYYQKNRDKIKEYNKAYSTNHKIQINLYVKQRRLTNTTYRIACNLRHRLWHALKSQKVIKTQRTINLIGCSLDELKSYLEAQFIEDMSWDNYGEWHIDHIKPCASFDLTDPEQQKQCFHFTNLQPLWAEDNLRKSDKYIA